MAYRKLSELVNELGNPQQSEVFVKLFRAAVREGKLDAFDLPERFTLPKQYRQRGTEGTYQRNSRDMLYQDSQPFKQWLADINTLLARAGRRQGKVKPSLEAVESGELDFKALAADTRRKLQAKHERGQQLGKEHGKRRKRK